MPNEFYIILSGEVGIFVPRRDEVIQKESGLLEMLKSCLNPPEEKPWFAETEIIEEAVKSMSFEAPEDREFMQGIRKIANGKIIFKVPYLETKLGVLPSIHYEGDDYFHFVGFYHLRMEYFPLRK